MHHPQQLLLESAPLRTVGLQIPALPANLTAQTVLDVRHWTDRLFSFTLTRDAGFRFENGQFTLLGLLVAGRPILRPYSMASPNYDDTLEFLSIKSPNGPLTSRLQHIAPGDTVLVGRKPTGTLMLDSLLPGRRLYLFAAGTGLAPFLSLIKDPGLYARFDRLIPTHTSRLVRELVHAHRITCELPAHELVGQGVRERLTYYPSVTREPFHTVRRITQLIACGRMSADLGLPQLDPTEDRAMICGSAALLVDMSALPTVHGFREGSLSRPGCFVVERASVERSGE